MVRFSANVKTRDFASWYARWAMMGVIWALVLAGMGGLLLNSCSDKPTNPCGAIDAISSELLTSPVYSPIDTSVYYVDTGAPKSYFDEFRLNCGAPFSREVSGGIYRVRLDDDSPAELVLAEANLPRISKDGKTMYCIRGALGAGEIWKMSLPNGNPELVKAGDFTFASWYGSDTRLVESWSHGISLLDIGGDSLISLHINGHSADVSTDKKICHIWGDAIYVFKSGEDQLLRPDQPLDAVADLRWSPSGIEIAFVHSSPVQIRVIDLEGQERQLTPGGETYPSFTADDQQILYIKYTELKTPLIRDGQVWVMSAVDGSQKRQVTTWARIRP
jgi:hypothetical protein